MKAQNRKLFRDDALNKQVAELIKRAEKYKKILDKTGNKTDAELNTRERVTQGMVIVTQTLVKFIKQHENELITNEVIV